MVANFPEGKHSIDGLLIEREARPPAFERDRGNQELLAVLVDGAFGNLHDTSQRIGVTVVSACFIPVEPGDSLTRSRFTPRTVFFGNGEPFLRAFLAWVPLDHIMSWGGLRVVLVVGFDHRDARNGIVATVQTQQHGGIGHALRPPSTRWRNAGVPF